MDKYVVVETSCEPLDRLGQWPCPVTRAGLNGSTGRKGDGMPNPGLRLWEGPSFLPPFQPITPFSFCPAEASIVRNAETGPIRRRDPAELH